MNAPAGIPRLQDLPIPKDARVGKGWSPSMVELADHIGAYAALQLFEQLGGQFITVPADPEKGPLAGIIGKRKAEIMSRVYRRERLLVPLGSQALKIARRAGVLAAVRARKLTGDDAARILGMRRTHFSTLLNQTDEGSEATPTVRRSASEPRQIELFDD